MLDLDPTDPPPSMAPPPSPELARRLREAETEELHRLLRTHLDELRAPEARQALLNPFVGRREIELILSRNRLLTHHVLRRDLVAHPKTPEAHALKLVPALFWRDLARIGVDPRVPPRVRLSAERRLAQRLSALSSGEKVAIARICGPRVLGRMRRDADPGVLAALLENPRLTEGVLLPLARSDTAPPRSLELLATHRRWGARMEIRVALCNNPRTPVKAALGLLPGMPKRELAKVADNRRVRAPVRRRAELLAGRG